MGIARHRGRVLWLWMVDVQGPPWRNPKIVGMQKRRKSEARQTRSNQHTHARLGAVVTDNGHGVLAGHLLELKAVAALGLVRQVEEVAVWHVGE